ncbi:MAG: hypothetical protein QOK17_682 [Sphingomonadales bacterium]|nr:hypothetical protein [Sphingomonadales bacterium]
MADAQLKLSRRALLGAVCAAPAVGRHAGLDPASTFFSPPPRDRWIPGQARNDEDRLVTIWDRSLSRYQKAEAALAAAAHTEDEDLYDRLGARHDRALQRLLRAPAPHLAALAAKLDLALDERAGEFIGDAAAMKALKQDARRLAAAEGLR